MLAPIRLLHIDDSGRLVPTVFTRDIPPYAILSHTWSIRSDDEFLFEDLAKQESKSKPGYQKILFCSERAKHDQLQYFWIDTCCIDKWNLRELSNSINSMFKWYKNASRCYVLLSDVLTEGDFVASRWFKRGWTLQELIAPQSPVEFFSSDGQRLGDKRSLQTTIQSITGIPIGALRGDPLDGFNLQERKLWMQGRETREPEDMAYALVGIFDVSMDFRYGEGKDRALERLEEAIERASNTPFSVPFARNDRFVGYQSQLAELEGKLFGNRSTTRLAISGPGGVGKTQLALELAYQTRQKHKDCSIFWMPADDAESLRQAFTNLAQRLGIIGWNEDQADVQNLVHDYLSSERAGQWLLIFDNADHVAHDAPGSAMTFTLTVFNPRSEQGAMVFTTIDKLVAEQLAGDNILELPRMESDTAQMMLEACLINSANEQENASLLLKELSYLPLAITLAVAYMKENKTTTIAEYLKMLALQDKKTVEYISQGLDDGWQTPSTREAVARTWLISFDHIRSTNMAAADQLLFLACIDRRDIPLSILPASSAIEDNENDYEEIVSAIKALEGYLFVTNRPHESAFDLHRLVHLATYKWLQWQNRTKQQVQAAIRQLEIVFPDYGSEERSRWRRLLPHAMHLLSIEFTKEEEDDDTDTGDEDGTRCLLLSKCTFAFDSDGRYNERALYSQRAVEEAIKVFGAEHSTTLSTMHNLASAYQSQERSAEAEELYIQVVETRKRILGPDHVHTLTSIGNLANVYKYLGWPEKAVDLEIQVVEGKKRLLGLEDPSTLSSMGNLASTYHTQGRFAEALALDQQVLEIEKKVLGPEHPSALITASNLSFKLRVNDRLEEAEKLNVQVLETRSRVLGPEHPNTLTSMNNLAIIYRRQGRGKEAEKLDAQCFEIKTRQLGREHPETLLSMHYLAFSWNNLGHTEQSILLMQECYEIRLRTLGPDHQETKNSLDAIEYWQA